MAEILGPIIGQFERKSLASFRDAKEMYSFAEAHVDGHRKGELESFWSGIVGMSTREISEHRFLREYAWCVYVSGFSAATISKKFKDLMVAHRIENAGGDYLSVDIGISLPGADHRLWNRDSRVLSDVLKVFGNYRKAEAVQLVRYDIWVGGWKQLHDRIIDRRPESFEPLPMIGPALSRHLARNLGNQHVAKPDVHLKRLAGRYGHSSVDDMLRSLSD